MESIHISQINTLSPYYRQVWELREEVLRKPIGLSLKNEDLRQDDEDIVFIATSNDQVIGCLMLQDKGPHTAKLRQMAVKPVLQNNGIGRQLMLAAEKYAIQAGYKIIVLHARKIAAEFYEKLGYSVSGGEFTEVGIPHFLMQKQLCL